VPPPAFFRSFLVAVFRPAPSLLLLMVARRLRSSFFFSWSPVVCSRPLADQIGPPVPLRSVPDQETRRLPSRFDLPPTRRPIASTRICPYRSAPLGSSAGLGHQQPRPSGPPPRPVDHEVLPPGSPRRSRRTPAAAGHRHRRSFGGFVRPCWCEFGRRLLEPPSTGVLTEIQILKKNQKKRDVFLIGLCCDFSLPDDF
jgi:hypothetical protein